MSHKKSENPGSDVAFTEGQLAIVEKLIWKVGDEISTRLTEKITESLKFHEATCPWGMKVNRALWLVVGGSAVVAILLRDIVPFLVAVVKGDSNV